MYLLYDIETKPNPRAKHYYDMLSEKGYYKAPSNWKDQDKIKEYIKDAKDKDRGKAALSWWTGQIICITACYINHSSRERFCFADLDDEENVIRGFFNLILDYDLKRERPYIVGKNSKEFDRGFITGRAMALDLGLPYQWRGETPVRDIDEIFSYSKQSSQIGRLEDYAYGLQIPLKIGDGIQVLDWAEAGQLDKVMIHGERDMDITSEIMARYLKQYKRRLA